MEEGKLVDIIWHGHACFELRGTSTTVVIDPFEGLGIPEPQASADLVLCSHSHSDHNNADPVLKKGGTVLEGFVGTQVVARVPVIGIATYHDAQEGSQRGMNSVYVLQLDGLQFCHLGDLGHDLTTPQMAAIGAIDVLFTPVGGGPTIGPETAAAIVQRLRPRIIVPMHYNAEILAQSPWMSARLRKVDDFLAESNDIVEHRATRAFTITKDELPKAPKIIILTLT
jgi:L-ascorbate metabolism protein UlaG (beta-lactamase superfamily)